MRKILFLILVTFAISCSSNDDETSNIENPTPTKILWNNNYLTEIIEY